MAIFVCILKNQSGMGAGIRKDREFLLDFRPLHALFVLKGGNDGKD